MSRLGVRVLRYIYVALLASFGVGYLSTFLSPAIFWWTGLFAFALPYTSLLLVAVVPIVWLFEKKLPRWMTVATYGLVLVLICVRFIDFRRWDGETSESEGDLVVLSYNVPPVKPTDRYDARPLLAEIVGRYEPHLIGIPEGVVIGPRQGSYLSTSQEKFLPLIDSLGYSMLPTPSLASGRRRAWYNPTLSNFPLKNQQQIRLKHPNGWESPILAVRTEFEWQGREVVHYNVHLASHGAAKPWREIDGRRRFSLKTLAAYLGQMKRGFTRRLWEARELKALIDAETKPVVVGGDFNSTPHNWAYRHLASGMQDAYSVAGKGHGATYHVALALFRIDFVLASSEWEVVSASSPPGDRVISDHRPVVARLRLR